MRAAREYKNSGKYLDYYVAAKLPLGTQIFPGKWGRSQKIPLGKMSKNYPRDTIEEKIRK